MMTVTKIKMIVFCMMMMVLLNGCQMRHASRQTPTEGIKETLDRSIINNKLLSQKQRHISSLRLHKRLMPSLSSYVEQGVYDKKFDVVADKLPAREFFMGLVAGTSQNIMVHPEVTGVITLNLKKVSLIQALDATRDLYGYQYHRTSYGYEILPQQMQTRLFNINYLDVQRTGRSFTQVTTGSVSDVGTISTGGSSTSGGTSSSPTGGGNGFSLPSSGPRTSSIIETRSELEFWKDVEKTIRNIVGKGDGRRVTVNPQSGLVAVHAYPKELKHVEHFINQMQSSINRQVILEAKVLEVQLNDEFQSGIDWGILRNPLRTIPSGSAFPKEAGIGQAGNFSSSGLGQLNGVFAVNIKGGFSAFIQLLQTQGNVQTLSSPHVATVNNQKAVIKVGTDAFFVTGVSTTNAVVGTNTLPSQDVSLTPFFSGITLDVTPEISSDDIITLHIHPSVSIVKTDTKTVQLGATANGDPNTLVLPLASSDIRETDTVVRAKNGQVIVIGGLMQNNMREIIVSTPWASKIPFVGALFRRSFQQSVKSELVILLRPIVATNRTQTDQLERSRANFADLSKPFHAGGLPEVFGNEGERFDHDPIDTEYKVIYKDSTHV